MEAGTASLLIASLVMTFMAVFYLMSAARVSLPVVRRFHAFARARASMIWKSLINWAPCARLLAVRIERKRMHALRAAMPEALRLLCIALDSGSSLVKALGYAARNCDEPLSSELRRAVWDLEAGHGFDEAMENLRGRTGGSEFAYLAVAMEIQHASGGSLSRVLESVSKALHDSADMEEQFKTKTAQARLSARIVAMMPLVLLVVLSALSPGYLVTFFSTPVGLLMFVCAMVLEFAGITLVRRVLLIDCSSGMGGRP